MSLPFERRPNAKKYDLLIVAVVLASKGHRFEVIPVVFLVVSSRLTPNLKPSPGSARPQPETQPLGERPQPDPPAIPAPAAWRPFRFVLWEFFTTAALLYPPVRFAVRFRTSPKIIPNKQQPQPESRPEQAADQPESVGDPHKKLSQANQQPMFLTPISHRVSHRKLTNILTSIRLLTRNLASSLTSILTRHLTEKNIH